MNVQVAILVAISLLPHTLLMESLQLSGVTSLKLPNESSRFHGGEGRCSTKKLPDPSSIFSSTNTCREYVSMTLHVLLFRKHLIRESSYCPTWFVFFKLKVSSCFSYAGLYGASSHDVRCIYCPSFS